MFIAKFISILGYVGMMAGLLLLLATHQVFSSSPPAIVLQTGAFLLMIWARITFGRRSFHPAANPTEGGLITTGPYRFIRHPIYTAVRLFTVAGVVAHWSWTAAAFGGLVLAGALCRIFARRLCCVGGTQAMQSTPSKPGA